MTHRLGQPDACVVHVASNDETRRWEAAGHVEAALLQVPVGWTGDAISVAESVGDALLVADAIVVDEDDDELETVETVETIELPDEVSRAIRRLLEEGRAGYRHQRWLRRDLDDLWKADLVVVGTDGPDGGEAAGRLREEILAVRRDEALLREVMGRRGDWPRSCFVADLRDRTDDGTRKVVQAVKRRWR